jgi:hypothetical protein
VAQCRGGERAVRRVWPASHPAAQRRYNPQRGCRRVVQLDVAGPGARQYDLAVEEHIDPVGGLTFAEHRSRVDVLNRAFAAQPPVLVLGQLLEQEQSG